MDPALSFGQVTVALGGKRFEFLLAGKVVLAQRPIPASLRHVDFAGIDAFIKRSRADVAEHVAGPVRALLHGEPDAREQLVAGFEEAFRQIAEEGAAQVRREVGQARPRTLAADGPKRSLQMIATVAVLAAETVIRSMEGTLQRLSVLGTPDDETSKRIEMSVTAAADREARDGVTLALNAGRMAEADELGPETRVLYTSILDQNRCEQCAAADDNVPRTLDDPIRLARRPPNPNCAGWTRCRCIEIYLLDGGATTLSNGNGAGARSLEQELSDLITLGRAHYNPNQPRDPGGEGGGRWVKGPGAGALSQVTMHGPTAYSEAKSHKYGYYPSVEERQGWARETTAVLDEAMTRYPRLRHPADGKPLRDVVFTSNSRAPYVKEIRAAQDGEGIAAVVNSDDMGDHCILAINDFTPVKLPSPLASRIGTPATVSGHAGAVWHEVGHLLTQAQGIGLDDEGAAVKALHEYGIHFVEIEKLSPYAASSPTEAIGELSAMLHTPGFADQLDPELRRKATAMFAAWGGAHA